MAQTVCMRIVDRGPGPGATHRAKHVAGLHSKIVVGIVACVVTVAFAGFHRLAEARTADIFSPAEFAAQTGDHFANSNPGHPQNTDAPPVCEVNPAETEDVLEDSNFHSSAASLTLPFTPLSHLESEVLRLTSAHWTTRFLASTTLPRGPPRSGR